MIKVEIVCNSTLQVEEANRIKDIDNSNNVITYIIYNENNTNESHKARMLKHYWGATICPFALVSDNDKPLKGFWSEAGNMFNDLVKYLNEIKLIL